MTDSSPWPATQTETWRIAALKPYERNSRTHSVEQVEEIAASMLEFGWTVPCLIKPDGTIAAGHGRVMAAELLISRGHSDFQEVPVIVARGWSDEQFRAYVIADNRLAEKAGWNVEVLRTEVLALKELHYDLKLTGFTLAEVNALQPPGAPAQRDPDDTPPVADPVSQPGDLWRLGDHLIICGSCTEPTVVERVLQGVKPHLMVTDPPWGVNYDPGWRGERLQDGHAGRAVGKVMNDHCADWREAWALFPGEVAYVWHGGLTSHIVGYSLEAAGFELRMQLIWNKSRMVIGRGHYHPSTSPAGTRCARAGPATGRAAGP